MKKNIGKRTSFFIGAVFIFATSIHGQSTGANISAVIGLGFAGPSNSPDYTLGSNTLSSTSEGYATPQYMLGLSYPLPFNYYKKNTIAPANADGATPTRRANCNSTTPSVIDSVAADLRCHPLGAFISAKFSTSSSSTVNGVTFGITHKIAGNLSLLIAGSLSPFQQPSPGFVNIAVQTVIAQQAANNPFYAPYSISAMKANAKDAFDGFPTVLITNTGTSAAPSYTPGAQIYNGSVLITNYKPGFLIGVALTPSAIKLLTGGK